MPRPRPPNRIEPITFPTFGISWFGNPADGTSIVAYVGGGGSSKTGITNSIVIQQHYANDDIEYDEELTISTGAQVGVAVHVYQNPVTARLWLVVALDKQVSRYRLPDGEPSGVISVNDNVNAMGVNAMADQVAVGCENGSVEVHAMTDNDFGSKPLWMYTLEGHEKTVCACNFSARGGRLVTSAKDGMACIWQGNQLVSKLTCSVEDPTAPKPKRPPQVLVRGCAFVDLEGKVVVTVASARRGKAFLSQWIQQQPDGFECVVRTPCSDMPISAMSLSGDAGLLALGSVDGSILLWDVGTWKLLKKFPEVHELPVTCIAARPYPVPLLNEDDGVQIIGRSASADSQLACLTLQRRAPRSKDMMSAWNPLALWNALLVALVLAWVCSPVVQEARDTCLAPHQRAKMQSSSTYRCIVDHVLIAPASRPGISVPPY